MSFIKQNMRTFADMIEHFLRRTVSPRVLFEDGSYIDFLNREAIVYVDSNGRQIEIVWYFQRGHVKGRVLRVADIDYWDSPHETELITVQKKEEILQKIVEYCRKRNIPLKIIGIIAGR